MGLVSQCGMVRTLSARQNRLTQGIEIWSLVDCPKCGSPKGTRCLGIRGRKRLRSHHERWHVKVLTDVYRPIDPNGAP